MKYNAGLNYNTIQKKKKEKFTQLPHSVNFSKNKKKQNLLLWGILILNFLLVIITKLINIYYINTVYIYVMIHILY